MTHCQHLRAQDVRILPWKNGRGQTQELALWPPSARFEKDDFLWRISKASVIENGPFSAFAGYERILIVTAGKGLILEHGSQAASARLRPLEPYTFSGDWPTEARLTAGPIADFNVFVRRAAARATAEVLRLARRVLRVQCEAAQIFLHVLQGDLRVRLTLEEHPFLLAAGESLCISELPEGAELELNGESDDLQLILLRFANCVTSGEWG